MKQLLQRPLISEKSRDASATGQVFSFVVHKDATKPEVRKAVERRYGVTVLDVRMMNTKKRSRRWRGIKGSARTVKKALVKLKPGDTIEVFQV